MNNRALSTASGLHISCRVHLDLKIHGGWGFGTVAAHICVIELRTEFLGRQSGGIGGSIVMVFEHLQAFGLGIDTPRSANRTGFGWERDAFCMALFLH